MKKIVSLIVGLHFFVYSYAQQGSIYAIIIGISQYESSSIPTLNFAHKDAIAFAQYLRTKAGGNVPEQNIRLLVAEQATTAAVYDAMNWVLKTAKQNDIVYFYFAGHGDMENTTIYKLGFLLTYNTPANNYINNSIRMEDVNNFANTLSTAIKAKVIMITDACHSGKLAGNDFRGNFLVGNQLRTSVANEIRITSCSPDELSNENEAWGGGRGVFSFYLINGLIGFADKYRDGVVRLVEVKTFLDSAMQSDPVLKNNNVIQTPVIPVSEKTKEFPLSNVDSSQMKLLEGVVTVTSEFFPPADADLPAEVLLSDVFDYLIKDDVSKFDSIRYLRQIDKAKLPSFFMGNYLQYIEQKIPTAWGSEKERWLQKLNKVNLLLLKMENTAAFVEEFNRKLIYLLHSQTQEVINNYLKGSEAELERMRYYNAGSNGYDAYPFMLEMAMSLLDKDHFLYRAMEVNRYYFGAVSLLLKMPITQNQTPLINEAYQLLTKALALEKDAAYIYNTLGVVHYYKGEFSIAEANYLKAVEIAPNWAMPYSNLLGLYVQTKNFSKAQEMFDKAKALQPELQNIHVNGGVLQEQKKNYLLAEEQQQKSILLNSRHYLPFERLGYVYMNTTQYAKADTFFYEAAIRKKGYFLNPYSASVVAPSFPGFVQKKPVCKVDTLQIKADDVLGYFTWGLYYFELEDYDNAAKKWDRVVELDPQNPLVFHYYGIARFQQKNFKEADLYFNYAVNYFKDTTALKAHAENLKKFSRTDMYECLVKNFIVFNYDFIEDHYFLASTYEQWNHFTEAEQQYRLLIKLQPTFIGAYVKLWRMLELLGRFDEAESVIKSFAVYNSSLVDSELAGFYHRATQKFPLDMYWHYKAGLFYYTFSDGGKKFFRDDRKRIFPDSKIPEYVVPDMSFSPSAPFPEKLPGTGEQIYFATTITQPYTKGIEHLQKADSLNGTNDQLSADINDKMGDMYIGFGLPTYAAIAYQKSVDMQPRNTGVRLKLIDRYDETYQFTNAVVHLDTLLNRNEINYEKLLLFAKYSMHIGDFTRALQLLKLAEETHPYKMPQLLELYGRFFLLSNQPLKAIAVYEKYLQDSPNDSAVMYSISRSFIQSGNKKKAWQWLQKAINAGFNYYWVLEYDTLMNPLRSSSRWKQILSSVTFKTYPPPRNVYERLSKDKQ